MFITVGAIIATVTNVVKALALTGMAIQGVKAIGNTIIGLGKALGMIKPEIDTEELGDKALQSGLDPNDFDTYGHYVEAVEEFETDPERSKQSPQEEKLKKGIELTAGSMIEKYDMQPMEQFIVALGKSSDFFSPDKLLGIADLIKKDNGIIANIVGFLNGSEKNENRVGDTIKALIGVEKSVNPSLSDSAALVNVMRARK